MRKNKTTNFWEGETCECCGGSIVEKRVTLHRKVRRKDAVVENLPAGVCMRCGTRYYSADVLKTVEERLRGRHPAERKVVVPVCSWE